MSDLQTAIDNPKRRITIPVSPLPAKGDMFYCTRNQEEFSVIDIDENLKQAEFIVINPLSEVSSLQQSDLIQLYPHKSK